MPLEPSDAREETVLTAAFGSKDPDDVLRRAEVLHWLVLFA